MIHEEPQYTPTGKPGVFKTLEDAIAQGLLTEHITYTVTDDTHRHAVKHTFPTRQQAEDFELTLTGPVLVRRLHDELMKSIREVAKAKNFCGSAQYRIYNLASKQEAYAAATREADKAEILKTVCWRAYTAFGVSETPLSMLKPTELFQVVRTLAKAALRNAQENLALARTNRKIARAKLEELKAALKAAEKSVNLENIK